MKTKVLIVEDESDIARALSYEFEKEGFLTRLAFDGESALTESRGWQPDVILLDLILPKLDGFSVCRALRNHSNAGIIMLTARTSEVDRVVGLELGADDYVCKPFSTRELTSRVRAVLRRMQEPEYPPSCLVSGDLELNAECHTVALRGRSIELTVKEFDLLKTLMLNKGRLLAREELYELVWREPLPVDSRTLDTHLHTLREKIEKQGPPAPRIITARGVGYRFDG
ncbi:MAG: response regulator transcription factor [Armatimonadetes bacterium]|nr:response regulator transcription factor [Armatimonadota bacterium]